MATLTTAASAAGLEHEVVAWDDPSVDWARFACCVVRSTWNYHDDRAAFLGWCARVDRVSRLENSRDLLTWNTDKHYLKEAASFGLPVVPTTFVGPDESPGDWRGVVASLLAAGDVVVKPAVSAGSNDTERHRQVDSAVVQIEDLLRRGKSVMLQPYLAEVDAHGETGLVFVDGRFSHAFGKGAILADVKTMTGDLYAEADISARSADEAQLRIGERAMEWLTRRFGTPLYARVDLLPSAAGPVIIELELTEPSLYLSLGDAAAERLVTAVRSRL